MLRTHPWWLASAVALLGACGGPAFSGPPHLELGTGSEHFQPVSMDTQETLDLARGIQGGFHIWGAVRLSNLDPENLVLRYSVTDASTDEPLTIPHGVLLTEGRYERDGDTFLRAGDTLIFDADRPEEVSGKDALVVAWIEGLDEDLTDVRLITVGVIPGE